jgi:hypothetical protein
MSLFDLIMNATGRPDPSAQLYTALGQAPGQPGSPVGPQALAPPTAPGGAPPPRQGLLPGLGGPQARLGPRLVLEGPQRLLGLLELLEGLARARLGLSSRRSPRPTRARPTWWR